MNILWGNFYSRSLFFLIYITASSLNVDDGTANQVSNKCQTIKSSLDALGVSLSAVAMKWDTNCITSQQEQPEKIKQRSRSSSSWMNGMVMYNDLRQ